MHKILLCCQFVIMGKKYSDVSVKQRVLKEPVAASCIAKDGLHVLVGDEGVIASTLSVDEYFDELIEQVRRDYAAI